MTLARFKKYISLLLLFAIFFGFLPKGNIAMAQVDPSVISSFGTGVPEIGIEGTGEGAGIGIGSAAAGGSPFQVQDRTSWIQNILKSVKDSLYQMKDTISQNLILTKEYVLDPLAWTAANVIIDQFGDALVDWIRNGFDGSPMFLSDPEGFFRDTANQLSGAIIDQANMEWLCNPLGKLNINLDFFFPGTIRTKYKCTFNDIVDTLESYADRDDLSDWLNVNVNVHERNITQVFGDDFRNGGFLMWFFTIDEQNNNIGNNDMGKTIALADDVFAAARISVGSEKFRLNLDQGFFGVRKCVEYGYEPYQPFEETSSGPSDKTKCTKYETMTPGQLVQYELKNVSGKDFSRLQVADEIDEIIGALATEMMGWLLTGGNDGGGVLGYDKDSDYSGSNRDHYGELDKSQQTVQRKTNISSQIQKIKEREENYGEILNDYADFLYNTKEKLEIVLAKLKCIRATSTNDTLDAYPDSDCDGIDEDIQNILLSAAGKTEDDIISDISKTESKISDTDGKISHFNSQYGENATSTLAQALELFDEFEEKIMTALDQSETETLEGDYCYSYDKKDKTGTICGSFGEDGEKVTYETHSQKEFASLSKGWAKAEIKAENLVLEFSCILDKYTQAEDVTKSECGAFEESSSSAEEPASSADGAGSSSSE